MAISPEPGSGAGSHPFAHLRKVLQMGFESGSVHITVASLLTGIVLLIGFLVLSALLRRGLRRYATGHSTRLSASSLYTVQRLLHYLLVVLGVLLALRVAGVPMSQMAVFAGALGVGLGFGLQAIFNNFISGLILLFDRSLKVGDFVELQSGVHGHVREIRIRFTRIQTNDGIDILVPNSEFVSGRVVNWTMSETTRRMKVDFRVALGSDFETVETAAMEAAAEVPFTLTLEGARAPKLWLAKFGESALQCQLVVWLNDDATLRPSTAQAAYKRALLAALRHHDVTIPYAQRVVHLAGGGLGAETFIQTSPSGGGSGHADPPDAAI